MERDVRRAVQWNPLPASPAQEIMFLKETVKGAAKASCRGTETLTPHVGFAPGKMTPILLFAPILPAVTCGLLSWRAERRAGRERAQRMYNCVIRDAGAGVRIRNVCVS